MPGQELTGSKALLTWCLVIDALLRSIAISACHSGRDAGDEEITDQKAEALTELQTQSCPQRRSFDEVGDFSR